jgi:hypothetical protein
MDYKSKEERFFGDWLNELKDRGFILNYEYEPSPFTLTNHKKCKYTLQKTKRSKPKDSAVKQIHETIYTIDFKIKWDASSEGLFTYKEGGVYIKSPTNLIYMDSHNESYIEIKPAFDYQNMTRYITVKAAWVYERFNKYVQIIKPFKLFDKTFYPTSYAMTDNNKKFRTKNGKKIIDTKTFLKSYVAVENNIMLN